MMRIIEYFTANKRLNYVLLIFLLFLGISAYQSIPKELFPDATLNKVVISGGYAGASANNLDKMAVRDIEDEVGNISHIDTIDTTIVPGSFSIVLTLNEDADGIDILNKVKDAVALSRQYLPADMNEPTARLLERNRPLINMAVSSDTLETDTLIQRARDIKSKLSKIEHITDIAIYGESDREVSILLDTDAINAYRLNKDAVISAIGNLSYTFPIGEIEQRGSFVFVSTVNGKADTTGWEEALMKVGERFVRLGDIATVKIYHPQDRTLATFNGKTNLTLIISKDNAGNAIELSQTLRDYVESIKSDYPEITFGFYADSSVPVKNRLDTVISNLTFGLILVFLSMYVLINGRTATIVAMGVPFAFIIGLIFIYYNGYTINVISLLGALIVIGIVVDDAIVISENIQRHIDEGMALRDAAMMGVREMLLPVTLASLTTIAAFMPMFMLTGNIGLFIKLIPIVVIMVLIGSLIESFLFLPLHAEEILKPGKKSLNWAPAMRVYERTLHFLIRFRKTSLLLFLILIPLGTFIAAKQSNFQFFPTFDGSNVYISGKLDISTPLEETYEVTRALESQILEHQEEFFIKSVSTVTGFRRNLIGGSENGSALFYITIELHEMVDENWINKYINPILDLSFDFTKEDKIRTLHSYEIAKNMKSFLAPMKEQFDMVELGITEDRPRGMIKSDIQINLTGTNDAALESAILRLEKELTAFDGVTSVSNNIRYGKNEYKLRINGYGEQLGLNESAIARSLSNYYLGNKKGTTFSDEGVMEITTEALNKDNLKGLMQFNIALGDGRYVKLGDVADVVTVRDYEKIEKVNGDIVKSLYANVDERLITSNEAIAHLQPLIDTLSAQRIGVSYLGEKEKNDQLKADMQRAVAIALMLMLIILLFIFPKIKYALMIMSVIPLSVLGALIGHHIVGINMTMPSIIGILGLAGVVINDGIIMLDFLKGTHNTETFYARAKLRLRPILITSVTTFLGLFTLMFYATGQAVILQPLAISLGFGLIWGTVLNLLYLPTLYAIFNNIEPQRS